MKIASELGKGVENKVPISQIQVATNVNPKSVSSRLSELVKSGYVVKESNKNISQGGVYYINTAGIHWLISSLSKKNI
jgi:DNA-binding HxlR family transcriptional regulator